MYYRYLQNSTELIVLDCLLCLLFYLHWRLENMLIKTIGHTRSVLWSSKGQIWVVPDIKSILYTLRNDSTGTSWQEKWKVVRLIPELFWCNRSPACSEWEWRRIKPQCCSWEVSYSCSIDKRGQGMIWLPIWTPASLPQSLRDTFPLSAQSCAHMLTRWVGK